MKLKEDIVDGLRAEVLVVGDTAYVVVANCNSPGGQKIAEAIAKELNEMFAELAEGE